MLAYPIPDVPLSRQEPACACARLGHAISREDLMPTCLHRTLSSESRHCALAQYSWLCLCHFMDLGLSASETPPYTAVLRQMATVALTAVGHKKRFRLLTQHVLPSRPLTHQHVHTSFRNYYCRYALLSDCVRIAHRHATHPGEL